MLIIRDRSTTRQCQLLQRAKKLRPYSPGKVNHARTDNDYLWCHTAQFLLSFSLIQFSREQSTLIIKINVIYCNVMLVTIIISEQQLTASRAHRWLALSLFVQRVRKLIIRCYRYRSKDHSLRVIQRMYRVRSLVTVTRLRKDEIREMPQTRELI